MNPKGINRGSRGIMCRHPEYSVWRDMKRRCCDPKYKKYRLWGGRGIGVCQRWKDDFFNFLDDMGPRPSRLHSIDRYPDKNGNYEPSNCRWSTQKEQCRNTRKNRMVTIMDETKCIAEWCEIYGKNPRVVHTRIFRGMTPIQALTTPVYPVGKHPKNAA